MLVGGQSLQGGLFDRSAEREANAQRELLEMALTRCVQRTEELQQTAGGRRHHERPAFSLTRVGAVPGVSGGSSRPRSHATCFRGWPAIHRYRTRQRGL